MAEKQKQPSVADSAALKQATKDRKKLAQVANIMVQNHEVIKMELAYEEQDIVNQRATLAE